MVAVRPKRSERINPYEMPRYLGLQQRLAMAVRRRRLQLGWTQEETAHAGGMATRLYQRVEAAAVNATLTTVARLCDALGLDVVELFPRRARKRPRPAPR